MKRPIHQLIEENSKRIVDRFVLDVREHALPPRSLTHDETGYRLAPVIKLVKHAED